MTERILVGVKEAATMLGLGESWLRALVSQGAGPRATRIGARVLFEVEELRRWAVSRRHVKGRAGAAH
jgi:excisionase family DNA binding protein